MKFKYFFIKKEPKNTFQSVYQTDNDPIRLSYHGRNHYNSVVDPYKATIGVGLGLPSFVPGVCKNNSIQTKLTLLLRVYKF